MHAQFSLVGTLVLVAWLALGCWAVAFFFRQPRPTAWHWVSLIIGGLMLTLGAWVSAVNVVALLRMRR